MRGRRVIVAVLSMLVLTVGQKAWATDFITDVMVIGNADKTEFDNLENSLKEQGWTAIDKDLNAGCGTGSDYIHLLYKTNNSQDCSDKPITDFYIKTGKNPSSSITHDGRTYYLVPYKGSNDFVEGRGDLNNNAEGDYIFLYYTRSSFPDKHAVTGISFDTTQSGAVGANGGATGYDLNTEAGGDYIYMHLTTDTYIPPSNTTVTIGEGSVTSFSFPFSFDTNYSLSQQIFLVEEIGMPGTITSIAFRCSKGFLMEGVQVYLKHTDKNAFEGKNDVVPISANDKVFEGTYSALEEGWATITLDTPFAYDGSSNLLVCCLDPIEGKPNYTWDFGFYNFHSDSVSILSFFSDDVVPDINNLSQLAGTYFAGYFRNDIRFNIVSGHYPHPANLSVCNCAEDMTTLSWDVPYTDETITGYVYQYRKVGATQWSDEIKVNSTVTSATINGLTSFSEYQFRVRALYGDNESSFAFLRFRTAMPLSYECGFEDGMDGWTMKNPYWTRTEISHLFVHKGEYAFRFCSFNKGQNDPQYLISPQFADNESLKVTFYYHGVYDSLNFSIGYSNTTNDPDAFTWIENITAIQNEWKQYEHIFPLGTRYVAIRFDHTDALFNLVLDDFFFEAYAPYAKPANLAVNNLDDQSATLLWSVPDSASPTGYAYQYKKESEVSWSAETIVNTASVTLNNLTSNTTYDFRVKSLYEGNNASNYVSTWFMTEGPIENLPHYQGFENGMGGWRLIGNQYSKILRVSNDKDLANNGNCSFLFESYYTPQYLISPQFDSNKDIVVHFYFRDDENINHTDFQVGCSMTTKDLNAFTKWGGVQTTNQRWRKYTTQLPAGVKYLIVKWISGSRLFLDDFSFEELSDETPITTGVDPIENGKMKIGNDEWYTIDGRKLSGKPKGKGVYIHNGKKAVIN